MALTDQQLRDLAWKELEQTSVGWDRAGKYDTVTLAGTHWGKAKSLLDQIGAAAPPPPPPPVPVTPPLLDMRATTVTAMPASGRAGSETPASAFDTLTYQNSDITLQADARFRQVFHVRMRQGSDWYSSSHNPWGSPADPWHQVPNSGELIRHRWIPNGDVCWYAGSVKLLTQTGLISRQHGWGICSQLGYGTLVGGTTVSPPIGVAIESEGIGLDLDGGPFNLNGWTGVTHLRANYVPVSQAVGKWVDYLVGVKWATDTSGWLTFMTRVEGGGWTTHYSRTGTPTAQSVNATLDEKQGGYFGLFGTAQQAGWEFAFLLRGLTLHRSQQEAEAAL